MTTIASGIEYAVHIFRGEVMIGATRPTQDLADAKETVRQTRHGFPDSVLVYRTSRRGQDGGEGWEVATDDTLDRIAYQHTASVLAEIIGEGLPLVHWAMHTFELGAASGSTHDPDKVALYASLLKSEVTSEPEANYTKVRTAGVYKGVRVDVYCIVHDRANAKAVKEPVAVSS